MDAAAIALDDSGPLLLALVALGISVAVGLALFALFGASSESRKVEARTRALRQRLAEANAEPTAAAISLRRDTAESAIPGLDHMVKRWLPRRAALRDRLARTGLRVTVVHYLLVTLLCMGLLFLAASGIFKFPTVLAALCGGGIGIGLPHFTVGILGARRRAAFITLFPEAIDLIVRGLKSGLPIPDSIATVAREIADPVAAEFRGIEQNMHLGKTLDDALWEANTRIDTPEFKFFVISLSLQRETGGNLAETLENLSDILRKRRQMRLKIKAMSSEARASAMIIGSLPFIMVAILFVVSPQYIVKLFVDPRGMVMIGVGLLSLAVGCGVMAKMVRFEI